jgi:hypothetical protein
MNKIPAAKTAGIAAKVAACDSDAQAGTLCSGRSRIDRAARKGPSIHRAAWMHRLRS